MDIECEFYQPKDEESRCSCYVNPPCSSCEKNERVDTCGLFRNETNCQGDIEKCEDSDNLQLYQINNG